MNIWWSILIGLVILFTVVGLSLNFYFMYFIVRDALIERYWEEQWRNARRKYEKEHK